MATPGKIFIVTAPSGAGKTTLVRGLLAMDKHIQLSVSFTTRAPREGEVDGKDYHFVSREVFEEKLRQGEFLESAEVYGNYYGTSQLWLSDTRQAGHDIVLEIDWQGAAQVRRLFPDAVGIFILPPSPEVLEQRLRGRGKDSEDAIQRRIRDAGEELRRVDEFDYVVINEHIDEALRDLISIVRSERLTLEQQSSRHGALISALKGLA